MLASDTILQDRYQIVDLLGQGGMGAVYQATDLRFGSTVALKEMIVQGDELLRAFEREARLLNKLRHGALPVVIDYFAGETGQFLVMQYIPGDDLSTLLSRNGGPFAPATVLGWADHLLDALEYLHTQEPPIIHRDIKPQNLKLTPRGEVILLDFGLSKISAVAGMTQAATSVSVLGYTPQYAPFEQINGVGTDPRSDLYSLAATLYHMLTGTPPLDAMKRAGHTLHGQADPMRPANEVNPAVSPAVASALHAAMAMNREERPASAAALRAALRDAAQGITSDASSISSPTVITSSSSASGQGPLSVPSVPAGAPTSAMPAVDTQSDFATVPPPRRGVRWLWPALGSILVIAFALGLVAMRTRQTKNEQPDQGSTMMRAAAAPVSKNLPLPQSSFRFETVSLHENGALKQKQTGQAKYTKEDLGGGVRIELVVIPGGKYLMGISETAKAEYADEGPQHEVTVPTFYLGKFEVTQEQWRAVAKLPKVSRDLNAEPSEFKGDNLPVENVSWDDANEFCARLSKKTGRQYRLPSESEWEYANRAGTTTAFAFGDGISPQFANYDGSDPSAPSSKELNRGRTTAVGSLGVANAFGLFDTHGNVWEWCAGEYHDSYRGAPADGSAWMTGGDARQRVVRGGSWHNIDIDCRSANRSSYEPDGHYNDIGFRVAMSFERDAK